MYSGYGSLLFIGNNNTAFASFNQKITFLNITASNLISYYKGGLVYVDQGFMNSNYLTNITINNSSLTGITSEEEGGLFYVNNNDSNILVIDSVFTNFSNSDT